MTKEDARASVMSAISMALKDPILQQGFESICKENAELETRNQELLESCEGATMMYKELQRAVEIIKKYLAIGVGGKITQNYLDVTKEAEQFLRDMDIDSAIQQANEGLNLDKIADEIKQDLNNDCPDTLCSDCTKENCTVKKLGLVEVEK